MNEATARLYLMKAFTMIKQAQRLEEEAQRLRARASVLNRAVASVPQGGIAPDALTETRH